jgi:hypothetical protein
MSPKATSKSPAFIARRRRDAMARASSVEKLPAEIRDRIGALLDQHVALDAILAALRPLGPDAASISRSALGRYSAKMAKIGERLRRSRDVSDALARNLGDAPESKVTALNLELMQSVILDIIGGAEDGEPVQLDEKGAMFVAQALNHLATARRKDADFTLKVRREIAAEAQSKLKALEDKAGAGKRGLDVETLRRVREEIYGIPPEQAAAP